jgi:DNA-binding transcriptional regulator GbsR (MarR family)
MSRESIIAAIIDEVRRNQRLTDMLDEGAAQLMGINRTDARAIDAIHQHGRVTAGELARELRLSTGAVTAVVDRLERAGYARRVADPDDRRRVLLEVTPAVYHGAQELYGSWEDVIPLYADYTDHDLELILRFQRLGREWLEERLAKLETLTTRSQQPPRPRAGAAGKPPAKRRRRPS